MNDLLVRLGQLDELLYRLEKQPRKNKEAIEKVKVQIEELAKQLSTESN